MDKTSILPDYMEAKDQINKFQDEIKYFRDLLHVVYEGICSGNTGPDEIENATASLYMLYEYITEDGEKIKEEYFS